jgi:hypothetical protein
MAEATARAGPDFTAGSADLEYGSPMNSQLQADGLSSTLRILLTHVARQRRTGQIDADLYQHKMARLRAEQLAPRNLALLERPVEGGRTCYFIKDRRDGQIREVVEV